MSTLLRTEVMGSTPGRHLEITDVTNGNQKKAQGTVLMHVINAAVRDILTFFLFE